MIVLDHIRGLSGDMQTVASSLSWPVLHSKKALASLTLNACTYFIDRPPDIGHLTEKSCSNGLNDSTLVLLLISTRRENLLLAGHGQRILLGDVSRLSRTAEVHF